VPSFSLRNPYVIVVGALIISLLGVTAFTRMPVDVFPNLKIPAVVVATFYPGMPPLDIERDITTRYERFFTLGSNIDHIESRSLPGISIITVYLQPGTDVDAAAAQLATLAMADLGVLPPGTLPPLVLKYDASSLPVLLVTVAGKGFSQTQLEDTARYTVRTQMATVNGASIPLPFGGKFRQIMAYVDRKALQVRGLSINDVVNSLNDANLILPAGDAQIGSTDYYIYSNSMVPDIAELGDVPVKVGAGQAPVLMSDVAKVRDASQIQYNVVLINGQPSVYIPVLKQPGANTISVVEGVKALLPQVVGVPAGMQLKAIFDQSGYIRDAVDSLEHEAVSGSVLAALVILIFLGSFRSTVAIFLSIPLSILAGAFGLFMGGQTINIMTLGGFALAIGRLVDDSVVVLENINRHLAEGEEPSVAARTGAEEVALPVLASTITTIIVFFPVMFLFGVAKYMFSALALAVVLSMLASYVVAMSIIPIFCARFLTKEAALAMEGAHDVDSSDAEERSDFWPPKPPGFFRVFNSAYERMALRYENTLEHALNHKIAVIGVLLLLFPLSMVMFPRLGTQLFPDTDAGKFTINIHSPLGSRIDVTEALTHRLEALIRKEIPPDELDMIVSNIGLEPNLSAIYSTNSGQDTAQVFVSLKEDHRVPTRHYMRKLSDELPARIPELQAFFSSGSIIDAVLNFGSPAPINVQISGQEYASTFAFARKVENQIRGLPEVAQTYIPEEAGYPTLNVKVDRLRAGRLGLSQRDVITNVITALTSNQMIKPSIWIDPKTGNDYYLTAQYPLSDINSIESLQNIPIRSYQGGEGHANSLLLRDVATIVPERHPAEADHYNVQRVVNVLVAPRGGDWGGTVDAIRKALAPLKPPPGIRITYRGSVAAMQKSFASFGFGLSMAVALLYLVMVAQFRSFIDPFIIMFAVPMGLIGVVWTLYFTSTTLNIESFMGIIVMVGIVVSNSILLVDFANQRRLKGQQLRRAVVESARIRMRPILMTALATIVGLMPIALKLGAGSEASAPLARAAAGGLAVSTVLTLFLVPAIYELVYQRREGR
jgi:hydrophobic/amphiphilic exporter-1 (mainly G- bacteria), HAE1 family